MLVTLLGIVIEVKEEHPAKAELLMLVTLFGIVREVKEEHPEKALLPIFVTLSGIVTEVKTEQPEKALPAINRVPSFMAYAPEMDFFASIKQLFI